MGLSVSSDSSYSFLARILHVWCYILTVPCQEVYREFMLILLILKHFLMGENCSCILRCCLWFSNYYAANHEWILKKDICFQHPFVLRFRLFSNVRSNRKWWNGMSILECHLLKYISEPRDDFLCCDLNAETQMKPKSSPRVCSWEGWLEAPALGVLGL